MNTDILFEVFHHLALKELHTCSLISKEFNQIAIHDSNWKNQINSFITPDTIQKIFINSYKDTLIKYFYFVDRFDWIYLTSLESKAYQFFKQEKSLAYKLYNDNEINGNTIINHIPTLVDGFQYIPELSEKYLKLFRKAKPNYMCLMTIHVFVKDESIIILIDSEVDEVFIFINEDNQYNIVGCMDEDDDSYNCYIASNDNAYYNTSNQSPLLFYGNYNFTKKNPVLSNELLDHIHWYFNEGLKDIWH